MVSWTLVLGIAAIVTYTLIRIWRRSESRSSGREARKATPVNEEACETDPYSSITPLEDFDWRETEPLKFRPFKPKYHLTMGNAFLSSCLAVPSLKHSLDKALGLTNSTISELVEIDNTYLARLTLRKQIMRDHHPIVLQAAPSIKPAVDELYTWLISTYLPSRFPTMFTLCTSSLLNQATSESIPLCPPSDPIEALEILGGNIDDDLLLLLPSDDGDGYVLRGFVTCFPSGFNTQEKFGLKLRDIHKPVPGYREKLEKSMDRFFDRIEVGKVVLRTNVSSILIFAGELLTNVKWAITTHDRLFAASGTHLYEGEEAEEEEVDVHNGSKSLKCFVSLALLITH